jgi:hypothetical protein
VAVKKMEAAWGLVDMVYRLLDTVYCSCSSQTNPSFMFVL